MLGKKQANWVSLGTDIEAVLRARTGNWRQGFIALFELLLGEQAEGWSAQFGIDFSLENPQVRRFIEDYSFKFAQKIGDTTVEGVRRLTALAQSEGWDVLRMMDELETLYDGWDRFRAEMIARSETIRSSNAGALAAYEASGVVQGKQWYTALDERVCPFCGELHGTIVQVLDKPWFQVGDVFEVEGQRLKIGYEDVRYPPLHPLCRCTLLPMLAG